MLHVLTSDTQTKTTQSKLQFAPILEQELHHSLHNAWGIYSPDSLARALPIYPSETQRQQKLAVLQRTRGNQVVLRMLRSPQQIARMLALRPCQAMTLQRKCACGGTPESTGECEEYKAKREAGLQRSVANQSASPAVNITPPIVHDVLSSPGQPLNGGTRAFIESRFGQDFSQVRVHTDARVSESARAVNALAYTVGRDMVFGAGQYAPHTTAGRHLLAHELAHTIQQSTGVQSLQWQVSSAPPAAQVIDTRVTQDQPAVNRLRAFLEWITRCIRLLLATAPPEEILFSPNNANIQVLLPLLDKLITDLAMGGLLIYFDQPPACDNPMAGACYDFNENVMHLRRFASEADRNTIAISLVHEYAHKLQDEAAEKALSTAVVRREHTREDELSQEVEARRYDNYFSLLLEEIDVPLNPIVRAEQKYIKEFETERTGGAKARAAATETIRSQLAYHYSQQLQDNAPISEYRIEISPANRALLYAGTTAGVVPIDLGEIGADVRYREALRSRLETRIRALPNYLDLFVRNRRRNDYYQRIFFGVFYNGQTIVEFVLEKP